MKGKIKLLRPGGPNEVMGFYSQQLCQGNAHYTKACTNIRPESRNAQRQKPSHPSLIDGIADYCPSLPRSVGFLAFMARQIERLQRANRLGTARNYTRTLSSFSMFLSCKDISFSAFNECLVEDYEGFLMRRGILRNTASFYMRILRAVYNKAVQQHLAKQKYPFKSVYTGIDRTQKRAVDEGVVERLSRLDLRHSTPLALARDLFVFSYCTRGMSFVDIAYLQTTNIRDGMIRYIRHKTKQQLYVRIEPCIGQIIARYKGRKKDCFYVFPILTSEDPQKSYAQYQAALNYYNRLLKKLSEVLELEHGLSSYTARHSWATAARNHNVPLSVISAAMGHDSERTTQIYLAMLENSVIDTANQEILSSLNRTVSL